MQKAFLTLAFLVLTFVPTLTTAKADSPTLYAVTFHADWCGSCAVLNPEMIKARGKSDLDNQNVLFITLDLTDETTSHQAGLMASALGIGDFYAKNAGKTGFVLLVNAATGEELGRLTKAMDADQIASTINEKIAQL